MDKNGIVKITSEYVKKQSALRTLIALSGKELVNRETEIKAKINSEQRNKILSNKALEKSVKNGFTRGRHNAAVSNIHELWENAKLIETAEDRNKDPNIISIKRFSSPVSFRDKTATVYFTVKEAAGHGHRIYSLELKNLQSGGTPTSGRATGGIREQHTTSGDTPIIGHP